jgi:hypothetical protein
MTLADELSSIVLGPGVSTDETEDLLQQNILAHADAVNALVQSVDSHAETSPIARATAVCKIALLLLPAQVITPTDAQYTKQQQLNW